MISCKTAKFKLLCVSMVLVKLFCSFLQDWTCTYFFSVFENDQSRICKKLPDFVRILPAFYDFKFLDLQIIGYLYLPSSLFLVKCELIEEKNQPMLSYKSLNLLTKTVSQNVKVFQIYFSNFSIFTIFQAKLFHCQDLFGRKN